MKRNVAGLCMLIAALGAATGGFAAGWVNITPVTNLQEWTRVAIPPARPLNPVSQWTLDTPTHTIICRGNGGHEWLRYDHPYKNFIFELQWRLTKIPGETHYNSGVFVRNNNDGSIWYQAQVGTTDTGYFFGDNPEHGALVRFNLSSLVGQNHVQPPGRWNDYKIRCDGQTLILWVNGAKQSEYTRCNNSVGYLGLEAEGSRIEFRRLRVKLLP